MSDERDPRLEALFSQAEQNLVDDDYIEAVMFRIRRHRRNALIGRFGAVAMLVILELLLSSPLQNSAVVLVEALSTTLFEVEGEWVEFAFGPLNNVAGLLGLLLLGAHFLYRRRTR